MRLLLYCPVFVRPSETFIYDLATELDSSGVDVSVIAARRQLVSERPFEPVSIVPTPGRWSRDRLARRALGLLTGQSNGLEASQQAHRARIARLVRKINPDVILAEYGQSGVLMAPLAEQLGIPTIVCFHGEDATRAARDPQRRVEYERMFSQVAALTGPSAYIRDRLIDLGCPPDRAHVQHNGIRLDRIPFQPSSERFGDQAVEFLFVGRLTAKKDPIALLRSFSIARSAIPSPEIRLTIAGDGPLRDAVKREVDSLDLGNHVTLTGKLPHRDIISLFGQSHIYVQHSVTAPDGDQEGLPVSITEALAIGLPVISTRHSGIPEVIRHGTTGLLVEEGDIEAMARHMIELSTQPDTWHRYSAAGRRLLESEFSMPVAMKSFRGLLESVTNQ